MSKLLVNEPPLLVPIELVMRIGLKQSVILQGLIDISESESINFDGENPEIAYEPSKADIFIANQVPGPEEDKD